MSAFEPIDDDAPRHPLEGKLEPEAKPYDSDISLAISAKRMADAMERCAAAFEAFTAVAAWLKEDIINASEEEGAPDLPRGDA